MNVCHNCGHEWKEDFKPSYTETCENCGYSLHSCKNCKFYDATRYNNCSEPMAERVPDHETQNFCGFFEFIESGGKQEKSHSSRKNFDDLFNN